MKKKIKIGYLTLESAIGCQNARGIVSAVTAATPLYHDESAVIGVKLRRPRFKMTGDESALFTLLMFSASVDWNLSGSGILVYMVPENKKSK